MLYFLHNFSDNFTVFNLFRYITFRSAGASITAFLICLWLGPFLINGLKRMRALSHNKRECAVAIHSFYADKKHVPTMGGILIVLSVLLSVLLWGNLGNRFIWILLLVITGFGVVGFADDWIKLNSKSSKGLSSLTKLLGQIFLGFALGITLYLDPNFNELLHIPFLKERYLDLGFFFIPFVILVLAGTSNALNLTDGLDGLAIGCTLFVSATFAAIAYLVGRIDFASYLVLPHIPGGGEITVFCAALAGASAGFLWFNSYPAEVIMGDTGSLALGGSIGTVAVLIKKEIVLVIVGGIFVWEALSVILQIISFKFFKKRIFTIAPFHHHLQMKGWPESKITIRLWIIAFILAIIGLSTLKVR